MKSAKRLVISTALGFTITGIVNCPALLNTVVQRQLIACLKKKYGSTGVRIKAAQPARETVPAGEGE